MKVRNAHQKNDNSNKVIRRKREKDEKKEKKNREKRGTKRRSIANIRNETSDCPLSERVANKYFSQLESPKFRVSDVCKLESKVLNFLLCVLCTLFLSLSFEASETWKIFYWENWFCAKNTTW